MKPSAWIVAVLSLVAAAALRLIAAPPAPVAGGRDGEGGAAPIVQFPPKGGPQPFTTNPGGAENPTEKEAFQTEKEKLGSWLSPAIMGPTSTIRMDARAIDAD